MKKKKFIKSTKNCVSKYTIVYKECQDIHHSMDTDRLTNFEHVHDVTKTTCLEVVEFLGN